MTAVAMGAATGTATCPKTLNVTLAGATSSSWATDAIVKIAASIKTDSDGYKITLEMSGNGTTGGLTAAQYAGGCLAVGTTNPIVCYYGTVAETKSSPSAAASRHIYTMIPRYTAYKNYSTTAAIASATAITAAKWNLLYSGSDCSGAAPTATAGGVTTTTCAVLSWELNDTVTSTASWFQPKEISTKVYTTLTRFSAKESATWTGMAATSYKGASGCAAKALTGASALVAGAAVAFGAAALAF